MEEGKIEDIEELDTVIAELEISKGKGNLILCRVNSPLYRGKIIQTLRERFFSKVIDVKNGEQIIDILKRKEFDSADVLIWIMPEETNEDILNTLNNYRELFYESKIPNVMFYNQGFSESVIRKAPDFWRYRGNYYEFNEEGGLTFKALEVLTTPFRYKDKDDLLRRKRINEYLLEKVRDKEEKSNILVELGIISYYIGELDKALEYHKKALQLDEDAGNKEKVAVDYGNIGLIYQSKGELNKAFEYHENALKLNEELEIKEGIAQQLGNIGMLYQIKGQFNKALEYHENALKLNEKLKRKEGIAQQLGNIGIILEIKGELDRALKYHKKALKLNKDLERTEGIASQLGNIGLVYHNKGELDKALEYYEKALSIFKEVGSKIETALTLMNMGDILVIKAEKNLASDYYLQAQRLAAGSYISENISERIKTLKQIA